MEANTNSEMFEMAARREVTAEQAASALLSRDEEARKQRVLAARPTWVPQLVWACAAVLIVALIDFLHRRS